MKEQKKDITLDEIVKAITSFENHKFPIMVDFQQNSIKLLLTY